MSALKPGGNRRERQMVRSLERFFALTPEQRAWKFRLARRLAHLPDPQHMVEPEAEAPPRAVIPWKFKQAG